MALASSLDAWLPFILLLALVLVVRGGFRARAFVLTAAILVLVNDSVLSGSLKQFINRPRPSQVLDGLRVVDLAKASPRIRSAFQPPIVKLSRADLAHAEGRSFPSSHTINVFSVALAGVCFFGVRAAWGFAAAALVAYSRIYVGSHWPSDVITSIFLGLGLTSLVLAGLDALWRRRGGACLPEVRARHPSLFAA